MSTYRPSTLDAPSHSRLHTLSECEERYYNAYVLRIEPTEADEAKRRGGSALHAGLDPLHRLGWDALDIAIEASRTSWGDYVPRAERLRYMTAEHFEGILRQYVPWAQQRPQWRPVQLPGVGAAIEEPIVVQLAPDVRVQVVLDLAAEDEGGDVWVVDHKATADFLGSNLIARLRFQHQLRLYYRALEVVLERPIEGAVCNALYMGEYANVDRSNAVRFDRYEFDYTRSQVEDSIEWARRAAARAKALEDGTIAPVKHGGRHCSWCAYSPLCEVAGTLREGRLRAHYRPKASEDDDE